MSEAADKETAKDSFDAYGPIRLQLTQQRRFHSKPGDASFLPAPTLTHRSTLL